MKRRNFFKTMGVTTLSVSAGNYFNAAEELSEKGVISNNSGEKYTGEPLQGSTVRTYNYSPELKPSQRYKLKAGSLPVLIIDTPVPAAFAAFEADGPVDIEIECTIDVKWVDVRPLKAGVKPKIVEGKIVFTIPAPGNYSVEINGNLDYPLFIFANPKEVKPARSPDVIYFEAGKIHKPGVIRPKSNQQVYLEGGAYVIGAISSSEVENVQISGYGILDGSYNNPQNLMEGRVKPMFPVENGYTVTNSSQQFVVFRDSMNINIEGLVLTNGTTWQVVLVNCDNVSIKRLKLVSDNPNDDGIDIVRSRKVRISDCFIRVKDDCVVIKSHQNYPDSVIVDDVLVEKCVIWNGIWGNGFEIGFELMGDVKNVIFRDCDIIHVEKANSSAVFSIHHSDKAMVSNILYENIRVEDAHHKLFDLAIFRSIWCTDGRQTDPLYPLFPLVGVWDCVLQIPPDKKEYHAKFRGKIDNVRFKDIAVEGRFPFSVIAGYDDEHKVSNVTFTNITNNGQKIQSLETLKLYAEYAENITIN